MVVSRLTVESGLKFQLHLEDSLGREVLGGDVKGKRAHNSKI
jgi:hypothetical protein